MGLQNNKNNAPSDDGFSCSQIDWPCIFSAKSIHIPSTLHRNRLLYLLFRYWQFCPKWACICENCHSHSLLTLLILSATRARARRFCSHHFPHVSLFHSISPIGTYDKHKHTTSATLHIHFKCLTLNVMHAYHWFYFELKCINKSQQTFSPSKESAQIETKPIGINSTACGYECMVEMFWLCYINNATKPRNKLLLNTTIPMKMSAK